MDIDKSKELKATVRLINDRLHFSGSVDDNDPVSIDYLPPLGDNLGYTSLELLLLSLSSCLGSAALTFLRRMKKSFSEFRITSHGFRRKEHPTGFSKITMVMHLRSSDISSDDLDKVVKMSEETYCPVWSMLRGNVEVEVKYDITALN
jgi:putative redox protein